MTLELWSLRTKIELCLHMLNEKQDYNRIFTLLPVELLFCFHYKNMTHVNEKNLPILSIKVAIPCTNHTMCSAFNTFIKTSAYLIFSAGSCSFITHF